MAEALEEKRFQPIPWLERYSGEKTELAKMVQQAFDMDSLRSDPVRKLAGQLKTADRAMNINDEVLGFLNSIAVRNHLREISYQFNAVEAAYIVYWSRTKSTVEKLCTWTRIINELPNSREGLGRRHLFWNKTNHADVGLHEVLHEYILKVVASLGRFFSLEDGCYYQSYARSPRGELWNDWDKAYSSADLCIADALEEWKDEEDDLLLTVRKRSLFDKDRGCDEITLRNNVLVCADVFQGIPTRFEDLDYFFESLWLPIPCPFKKGDIVYNPADSKGASSFCKGMIVTTGNSYERYCESQRRGADSSDMYIHGYFQNDNGAIYHEVTYSYLDMEYVPREMLTGKKRVLLAVSGLLREEIDISLFSDVLLHVVFEELANRNSISEGWWRQESLESLGFPASSRNH